MLANALISIQQSAFIFRELIIKKILHALIICLVSNILYKNSKATSTLPKEETT